MNIKEIKGVLEINGAEYDPKEIIQALIDQGLKIHAINGSLLVGRKFIEPSSNVVSTHTTCPIVDHCKMFDQLKYKESSEKLEDSESSISFYNFDTDSNKERNYVDKIEVDNEDFEIQALFSENTVETIGLPVDNSKLPENTNSSYVQKSNMIGMSPVTKYGGSSKVKVSKIPMNLRGMCTYCGSIISKKWKHCAKCGGLII